MSTIIATTLSNGTVSVPTATVVNGSAKAWNRFLTSTNTVQSSLNVSSVTDRGTGQFTTSFSSAMSSSTGHTITTSGARQGASEPMVTYHEDNSATSASEVRTRMLGLSNAATGECDLLHIAIHGDLA